MTISNQTKRRAQLGAALLASASVITLCYQAGSAEDGALAHTNPPCTAATPTLAPSLAPDDPWVAPAPPQARPVRPAVRATRKPAPRKVGPRPTPEVYRDPFLLSRWIEARSDAELRSMWTSRRLDHYMGRVFKTQPAHRKQETRDFIARINERLRRLRVQGR